ncbi:MAG TPA: hypothetical protein VGO18_00580, partial [Steroidobacteraceae bacterium]|nr:hypothetical protein [Steroidobacteraceae bacterium]
MNATGEAAYKLADELKQNVIAHGQDVIFPYKQLASELKAIPRATALTRDLEPTHRRCLGNPPQARHLILWNEKLGE